MKRFHFLIVSATAPLLGAAPRSASRHMTTYRDVGCGCCEGWVAAARAAGYSVDLHDLERAERLRRFGLTETTAGCHTTQISGYLIEGHVPLDIVARVLHERPRTRGIGISGMPTGVAGMSGLRSGPLNVLTLDAHPIVYAHI